MANANDYFTKHNFFMFSFPHFRVIIDSIPFTCPMLALILSDLTAVIGKLPLV